MKEQSNRKARQKYQKKIRDEKGIISKSGRIDKEARERISKSERRN